ncbi:MAG: hypothetical protein GXO25_00130, partial [Euryarchaeota archaeon]|nr:hypothetical protein [Euryarchaeota archaeon]
YSLKAGVWYMATLVYDGEYVKAYINDTLVGETAFAGGAIAASGYDVMLGKDPAYSNADFFNGSIDDVRIYSVALNGTEIGNLYNATAPMGMSIQSSTGMTAFGNKVSGFYFNMELVNANGITVHNNKIENATSYGVWVDSQSYGNLFYNNSFYFNDGSNDIYNYLHVQAYDAGHNYWNTTAPPGGTHGYGNFWYDWQTPDNNGDGIVDEPYNLDGGAIDYYPLTSATPVPELSWPVLVFAALLGIALLRRRR